MKEDNRMINQVTAEVYKERMVGKRYRHFKGGIKYHYNRGRNDAIEEFIEKLTKHTQENWINHQEYRITWSDIERIAEKMRGAE